MADSLDALADFRMDGHNVIITGGAQNIGAGIARTLAGVGAQVMIADLQGDKAQATAQDIANETSGRCVGMACDVTKKEDIDALVAATAWSFGGISTLINNVGWGPRHDDPTAITEDELVDAYKLNSVSAYRMSMACLPYLLKAKNASMTNSGSFSSAVPAYDILGYGTAKAALNQMMISLAHMLAQKVRVSSVLIGTVMTEGYAEAGLDAATQGRLKHPDNLIGRTGTPRDIANAMLWLASPAAAWVGGQIVKVHAARGRNGGGERGRGCGSAWRCRGPRGRRCEPYDHFENHRSKAMKQVIWRQRARLAECGDARGQMPRSVPRASGRTTPPLPQGAQTKKGPMT